MIKKEDIKVSGEWSGHAKQFFYKGKYFGYVCGGVCNTVVAVCTLEKFKSWKGEIIEESLDRNIENCMVEVAYNLLVRLENRNKWFGVGCEI